MKPPRWSDEEGVRKLVVRRMREIRHEIEYHWANERLHLPTRAHELVFDHMQDAIHRVWRTSDRTLESSFLKDWAVIEAATRGDMERLIFKLQKSESLSAPIRHLITEFLSGERNLKTGRLPDEEQRGRPPGHEDDLRRPVHDAADLVPIIVEIMRSEYGRQKRRRDRAIEFAARIKHVTPEMLASHLKKRKPSRRRPN